MGGVKNERGTQGINISAVFPFKDFGASMTIRTPERWME